MLAGAVAIERVEAVAGRVAQVVHRFGGIDQRQFDKRRGLNIWRQIATAFARPYSLGLPASEAVDHRTLITAFAT
jgi:hypothetical protein